MTHVRYETRIAARPEAVWAILADYGNVASLTPSILSSRALGEKRGIGARRDCDFGGDKGVVEEAVAWEEPRHIAWEAKEIRGLPMESWRSDFRLEPQGDGTRAIYEMEYAMKGGSMMSWLGKGQMVRAGSDVFHGIADRLEAI